MSKIVSIHSFRSGVGKSHITANLAVTIARQNQRVGIIDTDSQSFGLHRLFELEEEQLNGTFNDYVDGHRTIEEIACDISSVLSQKRADSTDESESSPSPQQTLTQTPKKQELSLETPPSSSPTEGCIYIIPSNFQMGKIARWLQDGYDLNALSEKFYELLDHLNLDYLLVDNHAGLTEETLFFISVCDVLVVILRPESQDFQGTAVTVDVGRQLGVSQILPVINWLVPSMDLDALRQQVRTIYDLSAVGLLPLSERMAQLAGREILCVGYPNYPFCQEIETIAQQITGLRSQGGQITQKLLEQL